MFLWHVSMDVLFLILFEKLYFILMTGEVTPPHCPGYAPVYVCIVHACMHVCMYVCLKMLIVQF